MCGEGALSVDASPVVPWLDVRLGCPTTPRVSGSWLGRTAHVVAKDAIAPPLISGPRYPVGAQDTAKIIVFAPRANRQSTCEVSWSRRCGNEQLTCDDADTHPRRICRFT